MTTPKGFELLSYKNTRDDLLKYREQGALRGVYLGFPLLHEHYTMALGSCTDFTGTPGCFTKNQLVATNKGNVPISDIEIGDKVLSYNHATKENEFKNVTNTPVHINSNYKLLRIKMKDGSVINVTENHEFWTGTSYVKIHELLLNLPELKK